MVIVHWTLNSVQTVIKNYTILVFFIKDSTILMNSEMSAFLYWELIVLLTRQ